MPSFPAFGIKIKVQVSAHLTYFVWEKRQIRTNFNFNFNYKCWETGHTLIKLAKTQISLGDVHILRNALGV
jgi:hypothetical protein